MKLSSQLTGTSQRDDRNKLRVKKEEMIRGGGRKGRGTDGGYLRMMWERMSRVEDILFLSGLLCHGGVV
jgi:hypothetical protein